MVQYNKPLKWGSLTTVLVYLFQWFDHTWTLCSLCCDSYYSTIPLLNCYSRPWSAYVNNNVRAVREAESQQYRETT